MKFYKCFCALCEKEHELEMFPEEYAMMTAFRGSLDDLGRLKIACNICQPFKYSGK